MVGPSTVLDYAANVTSPNVLRQKMLHQAAAMQKHASHTLPKQKDQNKRYFVWKICTLTAFTIEEWVCVDGLQLSLIGEHKKTTTRYNELL